jgi:DNA-binding NtrC family response regulator
MTGHVLLFEPFKSLVEVLVLSMEELGYTVDIGDSAGDGSEMTGARRYDCVFINLDQNRGDWQGHGLMLAHKASALGLPVVMIPDDQAAREVIRAKGFLQIGKPFRLADLRDVMALATWASNAPEGSA